MYFSEALCLVGVPIDPERAQAFAKVGLFTDAVYGYIDATGEFVIEPAFAYAHPFSDGLAIVQSTKGMAYVDRAGTIVWSAL
ncbi:MAG TPA: WG repeat-containing protein [Enhygromyxa sp.]|nr:WG repeat-containing protein [Enhygromyxa sp.]